MIQLEFQMIRAHFPGGDRPAVRLRVRTTGSAIDYTIRLSAALRVVNLTHSLYDVMCAVAALEMRDGHATIPQVHLRLACTYNNVQLHLLRNQELFMELPDHKPRRFRLSPEAIKLMGKIKKRIARHE